jgi:hypothetical protein
MSSNDTNFELSQVREALANLPELLANATQSSAGSFQVYMAAGWSPVLNLSDDGSYYFLQIIDWTGGTGTKPIVGQYLSSSGWTNNIALASPVGQIGGGSGLPDGNKVEITVAGATWTINNGVVTTAKMGGDVTTAGKALLDDADAAAQRTTLGLGTVATQNANNVTLTGGTLQGIGVVTGSYTSNVNEALLRSCRKASAGTITKGQVVYITGSTGSHLEVELADADTEATSSKTFGVAAETITASTEGYVIVEGLLTGLSNLPTASFVNGDSLWLSSTAGGWQTTPPVDPAHGVYIGRVINASNGSNGSAFIKIQNGYEINELHDVLITAPQDSTQALYYDSVSGLWKNRAAVDADLAAITVFPRFDSDQSATATQKRTARRNIGFSDSFTTAELLALSSTEAAKLRIAYCSDCLSSSPNSAAGTGDMCLWDTGGSRWITFHDRIAPETDWVAYALAITRRDDGGRIGPFVSMHGDSAYNIQTLSGYLSGTGAVTTSLAADGGRLFSATVNPGSTATGSARAVPLFAVNAWSTAAPARKLAFVMSYTAQAISLSSAGVDELHWRLTIQVPVFGTSTSLQTDEIAFVMDDRNTLGQGATGSNLRAMCRINGTTLDWVDTGIAVASTSAFLIVAWEPNGPGVREGRARIVSAGDFGTSLTTHVDRLATLSSGVSQLQACVNVAKTLGTGNRSVSRRFMRAVTLRTSTASGGIIS